MTGSDTLPGLTVPVTAEPNTPDQSPLARVCYRTIERLGWLEVDGNGDHLNDDGWAIELALQNEVFDRAIAEPSQGLEDLRAKASLALDDMNRFHPEREGRDAGEKLIAVVLREVIALCA